MTLGRIGTMVADRYRLDQLAASADAFEHWRAHDERLGRPVVVRLDRVAEATDPADADAETEAGDAEETEGAEETGERDEDWSPQPGLARIARLNYPAVAAVYDAGMMVDPVTGPVRYAVSEAVEGRSLAQVMAAGPQPWTRVADWGRQICGALSALHGIGIAHGSLGPDNVAVRDDRMIKVFDAGLAPDVEAADDAEPGAGDPADEDPADENSADKNLAEADRKPASANAETRLLGSERSERSEQKDGGAAADPTTVLPAERVSANRISVEKSSVERTVGMTAAMQLNLADYEAKIVSRLPPGAPADMYALGALLWHAVSGEPPAAAEAKPAADDAVGGGDTADAAAGDADIEDSDGDVEDGAGEAAKTALTADPDAKTTVLRPGDGGKDADSDAAAGPDPAPLLAAGVPEGFAALLQQLLDPDPARRPTAARAVPRFAALAAAARASDKTMVVPPVPTRGLAPTQVFGAPPAGTQIGTRVTGTGGGSGGGAGAAVARPPSDDRRNLVIIGTILLLAALGVGIGLLVVNLISGSPSSQNNTPGVTATPTRPVTSITLPSASPTSASPSPTQAATTQQVAPPPTHSPSPSPSPSPSASPSPSDPTSPADTPTVSTTCILFPKLCASATPS